MGETKRLLQRRLEHWRNAAAQLIGGTEEPEENESFIEEAQESRFIELDPALHARCKQLAEAQRTTVDAVVQQMVEHYWASRSSELITPISREQLERNPLLQLDALSKRNFRPFGETAYETE